MSQQPLLSKTHRNYSSTIEPNDSAQDSCIEKMVDFFSTSLYLENTLATARDHLGN